jgi:Zn finger protein HypA/HybF involved in hydrogenase expression
MQSAIDQISKREFQKLVKESLCASDVFRKLNMTLSGGSFSIFKRRVERENIDISHFKGGSHFRTKPDKMEYEDILVENSPYKSTSSLRQRLIKDELLKEKCAVCGCKPIWMKKKLTFHLDHINGINHDHRLENLRLLCPNCHSQTETYCGKNKKRKSK